MPFCNNSSLFPNFVGSEVKHNKVNSSFSIHKALLPAAWIYGMAVRFRNLLYDKGLKSVCNAPFPTISIGNITAGGTGKTPHTEYLIRLLKNRCKTAVLSRGYGRHSKGFILASAHSTATEIGDEPFQMHRKFPDVSVAVCEDRAEGLRRLKDDAQVVLLDDAFQHRAVAPSLNILLVNYDRSILDDRLIPAGLLREDASGRTRADIIILTKCPESMTGQDMEFEARKYICKDGQQIFFTIYEYDALRPMAGGESRPLGSLSDTGVLIASGIASPAKIEQEMRRHAARTETLRFADHHDFSRKDLQRILQKLDSMPGYDNIAVITEKDAARLSYMEIDTALLSRLYVLPVRVKFLKDGQVFDNCILKHIENFNEAH